MRPLTEEETKIVFQKLTKYIGRNIKYLIEREDEPVVFRLHRERVYHVRESIMKRANNAGRKQLACMGTCLGKFTKTRKFMVRVTALHLLAQYAEHRIWLKPQAEMQFLYGSHVTKSGLGRITSNVPRGQGAIVFSLQDVPLGFGTTAVSTSECRNLDATQVVCFNQADTGEYLRDEAQLV